VLRSKNIRLLQEIDRLLFVMSQVLFWTLWVLRVGVVVGAYYWLGKYPALALATFILSTCGITAGQEKIAEVRGRRQQEAALEQEQEQQEQAEQAERQRVENLKRRACQEEHTGFVR